MCMHEDVHAMVHLPSIVELVFPLTMWVTEIEHRTLGLDSKCLFILRAIPLAQLYSLYT